MGEIKHTVTELLNDWISGDEAAFNQLIPLVHQELHRLAHRYMRRERGNHTLQTTALVNEAYLRFAGKKQIHWQNRAHFFAAAAQAMRCILIDYAKTKHRAKRGGANADFLTLDENLIYAPEYSGELLALDEALSRLAQFDPRKSQIVELRYFGGLSIDETALVLKISANTVVRDWSLAKAWLRRELEAVNKNGC